MIPGLTMTRIRIVARLLLALMLCVISLLALLPQQEVPVSSGWDKLDHVTAFMVLGLLAQCGFVGPSQRPPPYPHEHGFRRILYRTFRSMAVWPPFALLGYGVGLELAQALIPGRVPSLADVVADTLGLALAYLAGAAWQYSRAAPARNSAQRFDDRCGRQSATISGTGVGEQAE